MAKLFSIKEEYTDKIYSKKKLLELRRQNVNININEICLIYTTNPIKKITGYFIVKKKIRLPIKDLWRETKDDCGVNKKKFFQYFEDCNYGTAIIFKKVYKLKDGICLYTIKKHKRNFSPPQSYFSIGLEIINIIKNEIKSPTSELKELFKNHI